MSAMLRKLFTVLAIASLITSSLTSSANAALDDGYPEGDAAPGRTCSPDAVGQKTTSSYSGKNLSCILIQGIAKWWIEGDPLPAIEIPAAKPVASAAPTAPASAGNWYELYAITGAVLGGFSLRGGEGSILGLALGTAILPLLRSLVIFAGIPSDLEFMVIGVALLLGTVADELLRRGSMSGVRRAG